MGNVMWYLKLLTIGPDKTTPQSGSYFETEDAARQAIQTARDNNTYIGHSLDGSFDGKPLIDIGGFFIRITQARYSLDLYERIENHQISMTRHELEDRAEVDAAIATAQAKPNYANYRLFDWQELVQEKHIWARPEDIQQRLPDSPTPDRKTRIQERRLRRGIRNRRGCGGN